MSSGKIRVLSAVSILVILGVILAVLLHRRPPVILKGAVLKQDSDPNKQLPIADVEVTATNQVGTGMGKTDATGFFQISLPKGLRRKQQFILQFRHAGYQPLDLNDYVSDKLYVARMVAIPPAPKPDTHHPLITISNTRVRYTVASTAEADIG